MDRSPDGGIRAADAAARVRINALEGFSLVAERGGYARAVEAMPYPVTEPALHQQVRKLERALGVRLLERGPRRRMILTPAGRALHAFVRPWLAALPAVLRSVASGEAGELIIATEPFYVEPICARALGRLRRRFPAARLRLVEIDVPEIEARVAGGDADVGIAGMPSASAGLAFEELGALGLRLIVPAGHPLARLRAPLDARHLGGRRYVLYPRGSQARAFTDAALDAAGIRAEAAAEASSAAAMASLARAGVWPAFIPALGAARRARSRLADGTVVFDLTRVAARMAGLPRFGLLRRRSAVASPLADAFAVEARTAARAAHDRA